MIDKQNDPVDNEQHENEPWPALDDFETWGDYIKAWTRRMIRENRVARVSTNQLVQMEKDELIDLIDKLYQENATAWDVFKTNFYSVADNTKSGRSLTNGERERRQKQKDEKQKTTISTNTIYVRQQPKEDSFWDWINPFSL